MKQKKKSSHVADIHGSAKIKMLWVRQALFQILKKYIKDGSYFYYHEKSTQFKNKIKEWSIP